MYSIIYIIKVIHVKVTVKIKIRLIGDSCFLLNKESKMQTSLM